MAQDINKIIENYGFSRFSFILLLIISTNWFFDGIEICISSLIAPKLRCEWNLSHFETACLSASVFLGMGIGSLYVGWSIDKHGRKMIYILAITVTLYFSCLCIFVDSFLWFTLIRFFVGFGVSGIIITPCYLTEYYTTKDRLKCMFITEIYFAGGNGFATLMAYLFLNNYGWKVFLSSLLPPIILTLLMSFWLPESIRYLQNTGNYDQLMKTLHYISQMNKKPLPKTIDLKTQNNIKRGSFKYIYKNHFWATIASILMFASQLICYHGEIFINAEIFILYQDDCSEKKPLSHTNQSLCRLDNNDEYLRIFYSSIGDIVGVIFGIFMSMCLGRKSIIYICNSINIIGLLLLNICLSNNGITVVMFICRAMSGISAATAFLLIGETFHTTIRGTIFGLCNSAGRICVIMVPFLVQWLMHVSFSATIFIFVTLLLISLLSTLAMPKETSGKYIDEMDK